MGSTSFFILSMPSNMLTLSGLVMRNGNATSDRAELAQNGGAAIVAAGTL
jgi:hypothetical protein